MGNLICSLVVMTFYFYFFLYCSFKKSVFFCSLFRSLVCGARLVNLWKGFHFYVHNMKCCCTSMIEMSVLFVISHLSGIRAVYRTSLFLCPTLFFVKLRETSRHLSLFLSLFFFVFRPLFSVTITEVVNKHLNLLSNCVTLL